METLLEVSERMPYHTDLRQVFRAMDGRQREFNWLVTDLDCNYLGELTDRSSLPLSGQGLSWLTGDELTRLVDEHDIQFVWAVLSGFPPGVALDLERLEIEPYADGNPGFWVAQPGIQQPRAEIEIVCWDSTCTLLLCRDRSIGEAFRRYFPEAVDLAEDNRKRRVK